MFTFGPVFITVAMLLSLINISTSAMLKERAQANVANTLGGISNTVEVFNTAMTNEASSFARLFADEFGEGRFALDAATTVDIGGKPTPSLKHDGKTLNLDFAIPGKFTSDTGVVATIFAASGDEFVRVSTSLKKENGERAVGTQFDHAHPSYAPLRAGGNYIGLTTLFGKQYITQYDPIKDSGGRVIGVLFIGLDISRNMAMLKEKIKAIKIGDTGYIYVVNAAPGKALGNALVHPSREGENLIDSKSSDERLFVKDMLKAREGSISYSWADSAGAAPRDRYHGRDQHRQRRAARRHRPGARGDRADGPGHAAERRAGRGSGGRRPRAARPGSRPGASVADLQAGPPLKPGVRSAIRA